jgi:chaperonin GroES
LFEGLKNPEDILLDRSTQKNPFTHIYCDIVEGVIMFDKFEPKGDRVLVKRLESEEKTASGIIIPDSAKEKAQLGTVLAVGPGKKDKDGSTIPVDVKVKDTIYFGKYSGTDVGDDYLIIREDEILGTINR